MIALSLLCPNPQDGASRESSDMPEFFVDLNLDQIVGHITAGKDEYRLKPFFHVSLDDADTVLYRHEVMRDLENPELYGRLAAFADGMRVMRDHLTRREKLHYVYQQHEWLLGAVELYCETVRGLARDLHQSALASRGFLALSTYVDGYVESDRFKALVAESERVRAGLEWIDYCMLIKGDTITVRKCQEESDYSASVMATFEKFRQGAAKDYRVRFSEDASMNHIEAKVLEFVAQLFPDVFAELEAYCGRNQGYLDETLEVFDREVQFYVAYLDYMNTFRRAGLDFCCAEVDDTKKDIFAQDVYDLALAGKLIGENQPIVCNEFHLEGSERIFIVSGPNQGGKTTFSRTFGQLHYLANLGCPVPGKSARLFLYDKLYAHFEREENIRNLRGKLEDDLVRIHRILRGATPRSIIIMNEIFTSTTLRDAVFLASKIMQRIVRLDLLCVCVTFIDELTHLSGTTVSMISTVVPGDPSRRTYKVVRRPADGRSYAMSIAEKYRLGADDLKERLPS